MASRSYTRGSRTVTLSVLPGKAVIRHTEDSALGGLGTTRRASANPDRLAGQAGADLLAAGYEACGDWDDAA